MKSPEVTIYSRKGCHLCENVVVLLAPLQTELGFTLREVLIDGDQELENLYGQLIPVVHVNEKYFSHFYVDLDEFKSFLEKHHPHQ